MISVFLLYLLCQQCVSQTNWTYVDFTNENIYSDNNNTASTTWVWNPDGVIESDTAIEINYLLKNISLFERVWSPNELIARQDCSYSDRIAFAIVHNLDTPSSMTPEEYATEFVNYLYSSWTISKWPAINVKNDCNNTGVILYVQVPNILVLTAGFDRLTSTTIMNLMNTAMNQLSNNTSYNITLTDSVLFQFSQSLYDQLEVVQLSWWASFLIMVLMAITAFVLWNCFHQIDVYHEKIKALKKNNANDISVELQPVISESDNFRNKLEHLKQITKNHDWFISCPCCFNIIESESNLKATYNCQHKFCNSCSSQGGCRVCNFMIVNKNDRDLQFRLMSLSQMFPKFVNHTFCVDCACNSPDSWESLFESHHTVETINYSESGVMSEVKLTKSINGPLGANESSSNISNDGSKNIIINDSKKAINDNNNVDDDDKPNCLSIAFFVNWIKQYFTKYLGIGIIKKIPELPWYDTIIASIGSFLAVAFVAIIAQYAKIVQVIPPFGATIIILFCIPDSPAARPRVAWMGSMIGAIVGVTVQYILGSFSIFWVRAGLSLGFTVLFQYIFRCIHPPGGAVCLVPITTTFFKEYGYWFLLFPVATGVCIMICTCIVVTNFSPNRRYPSFWL